MVDLAKIRKKAKKGVGAGTPARAATGEAPAATPATLATPEAKLGRFLAEAGKRRFVPASSVEAPADQVEILTFVLGGERYAIAIDRIVQIVSARPATPVPNAARGVVGIVSLRGSIVTLIDIRARLRQPPRIADEDTRIIVVEDGQGLAGFAVDRVLRPARIDRATIEPQPVVHSTEESEAILGVIRAGDSLTILLDLDKLLE